MTVCRTVKLPSWLSQVVLGVALFAGGALLAVMVTAINRPASVGPDPLEGRQVPSFVLPTLEGGEEIKLEEEWTRPVLINFWASWCEACKEETEDLSRLYQNYREKVAFFAVAIRDDRKSLRLFLKDHPLSLPVLVDVDGEVAVEYGVTGIPETFLLRPGGKVYRRWRGPVEYDEVAPVLDQLLAQTGE